MATKQKQESALPATVAEDTSADSTPVMEVIEGGASKTPRVKLQHIEPSQFAELRDELGFSNKDVAAAIGRTLSRVSELTHSQGASIRVWESYEAALRAYTPPAVEPESE